MLSPHISCSYHIKICSQSRLASIFQLSLLLASATCCYFLSRSLEYSPGYALSFSCLLLLLGSLLFMIKRGDVELLINDDGEVTVVVATPTQRTKGQLTSESFATAMFCQLVVVPNNCEKSMKQILWKDMVDDRSYRRLCRIIRLKRGQV